MGQFHLGSGLVFSVLSSGLSVKITLPFSSSSCDVKWHSAFGFNSVLLIYTTLCLDINAPIWWLSLLHQSNIQSFFPNTLGEVALGGISHFFDLKKKSSTWDPGKRCLFLAGFFFQLRLNRHPVSNQAENFGPAERVSLFRCTLAICRHFWISSGVWALPSLDDVFLIPCIVQIFSQVASMLQINLLILRNHQPLVILFSSFVTVTPAHSASCYSQIFTVTSSFQTASSSLSLSVLHHISPRKRETSQNDH